MSILSKIISLFSSGLSTDHYYKSMNEALKRLNKEYTMLHYPYHLEEKDSFLEAQKNLTDFCISQLTPINGKKILEIGCGNGVQAKYILDKYTPESMVGIDLNPTNIKIAKSEAKRLEICNITFHIDDAQQLSTIESESMDYIINIESAFHYPDKASFLREVFRVLKPGGTFLIADILTLRGRKTPFRKMWKKKMNLHHWPLETYNKELFNAKLHVVSFSDITNKVIHGFQNYRYWLKSLKKKNFIEDLSIKIYYSIHVELNIYLLRSRRQYCVFVGKRPFGT